MDRMDQVFQQALNKHGDMMLDSSSGLNNVKLGLESLELITQFIEISNGLHDIFPTSLAQMLTNVQMMLHIGIDQITAHTTA
ncbi:hypothetical protein K6Y31_04970 [Motilimonas cestriensis]|uniref:Uncharacterized protein n=1 Tax=Motilimonas cestriensis TaxID=2742685 RepID=A0ABS8W7S7_9GAMM|nr:hypothetical protein [Motilimonas cestriensis]MCE2594162.1 hypothetical protein [Motilimonas cestriensis]